MQKTELIQTKLKTFRIKFVFMEESGGMTLYINKMLYIFFKNIIDYGRAPRN